MKKVLVTGIAGFIGYHTAKKLINSGVGVVGIDNLNDYYDPNLKIARLKQLGIDYQSGKSDKWYESSRVNFYKGDIALKDDLKEVYDKYAFDSVIHLAAQAGVRYSIENPDVYIESNVIGFFNILELCRSKGIRTLTYASSSSVYGIDSKQPFSENEKCDKPISLYAATKRSNELMAHTYAHLYKLNVLGLRFFTVYGPWGRPDMAPILFARAAYEGSTINVFNKGNQSRDFTYVDDIVQGVLLAHQQNKAQTNMSGNADIMNIGNGNPVTLMDFIGAIEKHTGKELDKKYVEAQPGDVSVTYADTNKLTQSTGYTPLVDVDNGVKYFIDWYQEYMLQ